MPSSAFGIGIDIGGTKTCAVVVDDGGNVIGTPVEAQTGRERQPSEIVDTLVSVYDAATKLVPGASIIRSLGLAVATTLDENGRLVTCPNLPTMGGFNLKQEMERRVGRAVVVENDANCQAYGEWRAGAAQGFETCCVAALGTGFGIGIIIDGCILRGAHGSAGEVCYSPAPDGRNVEDIASGLGVAAEYKKRTGWQADAREVAVRARNGDIEAIEIWREFGETLGFALSYVVNILDPGVIVIGGSLSNALDCFEVPMHEILARHSYDYKRLVLRKSALGLVAAAVGVALLSSS